MAYNLTQVGNVTNFLEFTQNVNHYLMNDTLGILFLIGIGIVLVSGFYWSTRDAKNSILATSFILFVLGILFKAINLIDSLTLLVLFAGTAIAAAFTWQR